MEEKHKHPTELSADEQFKDREPVAGSVRYVNKRTGAKIDVHINRKQRRAQAAKNRRKK